uniref:Nucleoporin 43 n=1 Tax=Eptatretus burgeri TaxID=7764 RepID=A0A8C4RC49_EPTBU
MAWPVKHVAPQSRLTVFAKVVTQKVSKVRWQPGNEAVCRVPDVFATGSWDDEAKNRVSLWKLGDTTESVSAKHNYADPRLLCSINHPGDVMDLQFLDQERLVAASSMGTVSIIRRHSSETLSIAHRWENLHRLNSETSPCTSVAFNNPDIASVGEDGTLNLLRVDTGQRSRTYEQADCTALNDIMFLSNSELLTVNTFGQLKVWDVRQETCEAVQVFSMAGSHSPLLCLDRHPMQGNVVAAGSLQGSLHIWDIRKGSLPVSILDAHKGPMWEVRFHPTVPNHLFTCSEDGSLWHWALSEQGKRSGIHGHQQVQSSLSDHASTPINNWVVEDPTLTNLQITNLLPEGGLSMNSLDIFGQFLVCGSDREAVYVVSQLGVY